MTSRSIAGVRPSAQPSHSGVGSSGIHQLPGRPPSSASNQHLSATTFVVRRESSDVSSQKPLANDTASLDGTTTSESRGTSLRYASGHEIRSQLGIDDTDIRSEHTMFLKTRQRPRGQPILHCVPGDDMHAEHMDISESMRPGLGLGTIRERNTMPMPRRNAKHMLVSTRSKNIVTTLAVTKKEARPKPYAMEVSPAAPRYPPAGHVDHFPWNPSVPENQYSDDIIRHGYFDKPPNAMQREVDTAKNVLYNSLKQKSGLQALSGLFTNILHQRRVHGIVSAPSTFKPPPRVTLPDGRREIWLKDLANPEYALRKLSRSIPHGIKNKQLLEHCWAKRVPIERAIWLTKCVGANELRAANRPRSMPIPLTMGGEAKWVREWTGFVEQFVETAINSCGEVDWKDRISYS